ncbi:RNA-directed DNA methylation 4-like [Zingiber officinale]|uniref:RNA-directed DNA methylation 4-like n=1 Tax=Zingiber officinale TaxID=94328 RepID=UPI001C4C8CE5|nr:RNA-directed DNA methylation 4-like [Zingiber officinale]
MAPPSITGKSPPLSLITGKPSPLSLITGKPVIVRVKRKAFQAKLDAFWLEIDERPHKKTFLGLGNLSISDCGTGKVLNELASKKILVQHLETVGHSQSVKDVLHSFLKHDQLRSKAIKEHEDLTRSSRFEQIWKKRGSIDEEEYSLHEKCHLYDVVRVDAEDETHQRVPKAKDAPEVDGAMFDKYLSLLREFLPQAVEEIEHYKATTEDNFVYDIYTHEVGVDTDTDNTDEYPLVQVYMEDDYDDGLSQFDYESDDSNAENNPWNDYCDEETSEDEDENESAFSYFEDSDSNYEQEVASKEDDLENWRWDYR